MDLSTTYCGFELPHPFVVGASPMADSLDRVKRLEDAGAAAITMRSLFEEQINAEGLATASSMDAPANSFAEALSYFPDPDEFVLGCQEYLDHLRKVKESVGIPVFGSLNGMTAGGWLDYAKLIEQAGADGLELHVYQVPTDPDLPGEAIEARTIEMVRQVKNAVKIPLAVKLSPFHTNFGNMAKKLDAVGADALVLFNRFYQPDIDIANLEVVQHLDLSISRTLPLRLRWLAICCGHIRASLAVTGGVHTPEDAIKAIMCGANVVQMVSAIYKNGPGHFAKMRSEVTRILEENEYESVRQITGNMSITRCPDPKAYSRGNYVHILQTWQHAF